MTTGNAYITNIIIISKLFDIISKFISLPVYNDIHLDTW